MNNMPFDRAANVIRILAADAVSKAGSGHLGAPLGMAEMAYVLWTQHIRHDPAHPRWSNRDRFILSNGHASILLYSVLHLTGYAVSIDDLCKFRVLHSRTPGHPEYGVTPGVEITTGPLGQGLVNAVGLALAEKQLAAVFNQEDLCIVDHHTYVFVGDGCLMEGISHEGCSLAGTLGLGRLIVLYDSNDVSIDGPIAGWFTESVPQRFQAYAWQIIGPIDGHDVVALHEALTAARNNVTQPTLICCKTIIGAGSPSRAGTAAAHGGVFMDAEIAQLRQALDWPHPPFEIPAAYYALWDQREKGAQAYAQWQQLWQRYQVLYPDLAREFVRRSQQQLPPYWLMLRRDGFQKMMLHTKALATRFASQMVLKYYAPHLPELMGGSADLSDSNCTTWEQTPVITAQKSGRYVHFGVREFGMMAVMNGVARHGGWVPFDGTFLAFFDYGHPAVRMAALMAVKRIFIFTHDSIGVGEDGPTHQPVEQITCLRVIPGLDVWRPADGAETFVAWSHALERDGPSALVLSRQTIPVLPCHVEYIQIAHGAYILSPSQQDPPQVILLSTGSEVILACQAQGILAKEDIDVRVVSCPSTSVFERQDTAYRNAILPPGIPVVVIEAGVPAYWYQYTRGVGAILGMNTFGLSGSTTALFEHFHLTAADVAAAARQWVHASS